jgi:Cytochrome c
MRDEETFIVTALNRPHLKHSIMNGNLECRIREEKTLHSRLTQRQLTLLFIISLFASVMNFDASAQKLLTAHTPDVANGRNLYNAGCVTCHGPSGKGAAQERTWFKRPDTFPDFSACGGTTP